MFISFLICTILPNYYHVLRNQWLHKDDSSWNWELEKGRIGLFVCLFIFWGGISTNTDLADACYYHGYMPWQPAIRRSLITMEAMATYRPVIDDNWVMKKFCMPTWQPSVIFSWGTLLTLDWRVGQDWVRVWLSPDFDTGVRFAKSP